MTSDKPDEGWWWNVPKDADLEQGQIIQGLYLPRFIESELMELPNRKKKNATVNFFHTDAIVVTQSCDFRNASRALVTSIISVGQARSKHDFDDEALQDIRDQRRPDWIMLANPNDPNDKEGCVLVDLRYITPLELKYLQTMAKQKEHRPGLRPPYLEHFSAACGRYLARVALPKDLPIFHDRSKREDGAGNAKQ